MWNTNTIIEKVAKSADKYGRSNTQQTKQLLFAISKSEDQMIFDGLLSFFIKDQLNASDRQALAGRLLYELKPKVNFDAQEVIKKALKYYDLSVEELPYFIVAIKGLGYTMNEVDKINKKALSENESRSLETIKFWLRNHPRFSADIIPAAD